MINKGYLTANKTAQGDELYTPKEAIIPLLKYIPSNVKTIWCPFDTEQSQYVQVLSQWGGV